ncbi:MAG: NTP transferase domain-containing protein [Christensenellaceae bacterium]|jgi:UTP--glucose-1-phosphate uridylyltransferase|nr:NTP transferase domain-containing protein [Christensenellaceae bacterium]
MRCVSKAVITCGGYATRFLPITKAIPKEMLPIGDRPAIHYILDELESAGVTDVLILVGRGRECLLNYLDKNYEIDDVLQKTGNKIQTNFFENLNIYYRRVPMPNGVCDCVMHARSFVGADNFVLCYCDDIFFNGNPTQELLTKTAENDGRSGIIAAKVKEPKKYGVIFDGKITEKPKKPKSNLAAVGRYLLSPKFFTIESDDMIEKLNSLDFMTIETESLRFDIGSKEGYFEALKHYFTSS